MATIDNAWNKGVKYAASIDLAAKKPLDSRISVNTIAERDAHVTGNRAYEGMQVYVTATEKTYIYIGGAWQELLNTASIVNDLTTGGVNAPLSAEQGKALKAAIDKVSGGELSVPVATEKSLGGIKSSTGDGIVSVSAEGIASIASAPKLGTARNIAITGDVEGTASFDGSADVSIEASLSDAVNAILDAKAPIASPVFTGAPKATTPTDEEVAAEGGNKRIATAEYVDAKVQAHIAALAGAMIYQGAAASADDLKETTKGSTYKASAAFELDGQKVEIGDLIVRNESGWDVYQANIDGAVTGPASSVDANVVLFSGTTGKVIKDSGLTIGQSVPAESVWKIGEDVSDTAHGLMTSAQKARLEAITDADYKNVNDFGAVKVGATTISAASASDTVELEGADGITVSADADTKKVTITGKTYAEATADVAGLMSAADKSKLDGIAEGAQVNVQSDWNATEGDALILNKPTALPNAHSLTITAGTASVEYKGDAEKSIEITAEAISAMPTIEGTAGHIAVLDAEGKKVEDGGFAIPVPATADSGKAAFVDANGVYALRKIQGSDIEGLTDQLGDFVKKTDLATADADGLLSKDDFSKLADIEDGAQANVLEGVAVKGNGDTDFADLAIADKKVKIDLSSYAKSSEVEAIVDGTTAAGKADKLSTARDIAIAGAVEGTASFDGSENITITTAISKAVQDILDAKAPIADPVFTGTPKVTVGDSDNNLATENYVDAEVQKHIASLAGAMLYKGAVASADDLPSGDAVATGAVYKASKAFTVGSEAVEQGDLLVYNGTSWDVYQANIDGAVTGPAEATVGNIAVFDAVTGKVIKDSGVAYTAIATAQTDATSALTKIGTIPEGSSTVVEYAATFATDRLSDTDIDAAIAAAEV